MIITHEKFVKKWLEAYKQSEGQSWVAKELNTSRQVVYAKAIYLRQKGVKLPALNRVTQAINTDALNSLIDESM